MGKVSEIRLNNGVAMPGFGFGVWQLEDGKEALTAVKAALETGYRLIDTAKIYGNEASVGEAIAGSGVDRGEIFITTKLWNSDQGYESALAAFEASRQRLGMEIIDLYLIHWPGHDVHRRQDSWRALSELYQQNKVKSIGVSNYEPHHLQELVVYHDVVPAVNQIEFHPFNFRDQRETLNYCKEHGIAVEAYSPLVRGRRLDEPEIKQVAKKHKKTGAQVVLRWAVQHGTVPIPKSAHPKRIKENFDIFDFELDNEDMAAIDSLSP